MGSRDNIDEWKAHKCIIAKIPSHEEHDIIREYWSSLFLLGTYDWDLHDILNKWGFKFYTTIYNNEELKLAKLIKKHKTTMLINKE